MREILFRGRPLDGHSNWVYGFYFGKGGLHSIIEPSDIYKCEHCGNTARVNNYSPIGVDPNTVGQYTGVKDKNGTKIFEGDIIEEGYNNMADRWVTKKWIVKWSQIHMAWMCYNNERSPYPVRGDVICSDKNVIEVVGNIHDNPELIE